jgi:hypothetical protein
VDAVRIVVNRTNRSYNSSIEMVAAIRNKSYPEITPLSDMIGGIAMER